MLEEDQPCRQVANQLAAMHALDFMEYISALPGGVTDIRGWRMTWTALWSAFPDLHNELQDMIIEGDKAVVRLVMTGTHQAAYQGIPATGKQISVAVIDIAQYEDGKVKAEWAEYDLLTMLQQLGVAPVPA